MIAKGVTIPRIAEGGPPLLAIAAGLVDVSRASTLRELAARLREECVIPRSLVELARVPHVNLPLVPRFEIPRVARVDPPRVTELHEWRALRDAYGSAMSTVARTDTPPPLRTQP